MRSKEVLDIPEEVLTHLLRDTAHLHDLEQGTNNVFAQERLARKRHAIEDGIEALNRAIRENPEDEDASYRAVIEKFVELEIVADEEKNGQRYPGCTHSGS